MSGRRRSTPTDPMAILARRARERLHAQADEARFALPANADVRVVTDPRGKKFAAYRSDVFDLLHGRHSLTEVQHQAARRLQEAVATAAGVGGAGPVLEVIDGASGDREQINGRMMRAGAEVADVLERLPPRSRLLLMALIEPLVVEGRIIVWWMVAGRVTGVSRKEVLTDRVVCACEDLAQAWRAKDNEPRVRA